MTEETIAQKKHRVADFAPGEEIEDLFLIDSLQKREKRDGEAFYVVTLRDASGSIEGRVWDHVDLFERRGYEKNHYVRATLEIGEYKGRRVGTIRAMRPVDTGQVNPADFIAVSPRDPAEMEAEFRGLIDAVADEELNGLLRHVFREEGKLWADFRIAPSAKSVHQAYLHGLLEHTINVVSNARAFGVRYPGDIDLDILTAGALVHDMGKTVEYCWTPSIGYTDTGLMMGHIAIGSNMLHGFALEHPLDPGKLAHLHHLILSHHGRPEWGSPRTPATPEAFALHYADVMDARMGLYEEEARRARERGESWQWSRLLERSLYAGGGDFSSSRQAGEYVTDLARRMARDMEIPPPEPARD